MKRTVIVVSLLCAMATALCATAVAESAEDYWPAWRGPNATGAAVKGNPPLTWSETENIKWKVELPGQSSSSPIIWGDKIFFLTAIAAPGEAAPAGEQAA